jgi:hypothetical protein
MGSCIGLSLPRQANAVKSRLRPVHPRFEQKARQQTKEANLFVANVQVADAATYSVVVTNAYGSVTSSVAQLTVTIPPSSGRFSNLSYSPAIGFSFIFRDATVSQPYRIQRSSSLAEGSWTDGQSFTYTESMGLMDVSATGTERRFYRAVSP